MKGRVDDKAYPYYRKLVIYYFSGTGNARKCSEWIGAAAETKGVNVEILSIDRFDHISVPRTGEGRTLIGFAYPTHGFNAAPSMVRYISLFPAKVDADIFLLNTRAGMKLHKLFTPGMSGLAQILPAIILLLKGYRIVGMKPVDLPSNWISLHPGLKESVVNSLFRHWKKNVFRFADRMLKGRKIYRALWDLPLDLLVLPVSVGYYFIGRYALSKTFIATNACTSCGICEKQCPTNSIVIKNGNPYWKLSCESCMRCMNNCPERAIETAHSYTALIWYLAWGIISPVIFTFIISPNIIPIPRDSWLATLIYWVILGVVTIIFASASHYLLHYLMKFRFFNRLVELTSLTHFRFWRRYKAPADF